MGKHQQHNRAALTLFSVTVGRDGSGCVRGGSAWDSAFKVYEASMWRKSTRIIVSEACSLKYVTWRGLTGTVPVIKLLTVIAGKMEKKNMMDTEISSPILYYSLHVQHEDASCGALWALKSC